MIAYCAARTGCQHLGLLVGQKIGLHSLGLVGLLVKYSPDAGAALRSLVRYMHLHVRGAVTTLETDGNTTSLGYDIYQPYIEATDQIGDGALAGLFNVMRSLCGRTWQPLEIRFAHRKPDDIGPFSRLFRAPLRFDAERYVLVFATHWLNLELHETDPALCRLLQQQVDALETKFGNDFPGQVRSVLRTALLTHQAGSEQIAALFSIHSRTLNRRLNDYGTNFQELLDEGRFEIARQMLRDSTMAVGQIAMSLDYADASAFTRAFRRWSNTTPAQWREDRRLELISRSVSKC